jgi:superfamily I DNA/RNA helicase
MESTQEQNSIYDFFKNHKSENIGIEAYAGCGKTTTILQMLRFTKFSEKVRFFAFSNLIANELKSKVGDSVDVSTIHSLGYSILKKNFKQVKIKENKVHSFVTKYCKRRTDIKGKISTFIYKATEIISKIEPTLKEYSVENLYFICDRFKITADDDLLNHVIAIKKNIDEDNFKTKSVLFVDFNDMVVLPITMNLEFDKYDVCFFDESQDMSACHREMLLRSLSPNGRFVAVFDKRQSIYGFAGADTKELDELLQEKNAKVFPLSYSFRCSKEIVKHCLNVYEGFKAFPTNEEGNVRNGSIKEVRCYKTDVVLCRNVRPLLDVFSELIANNIKCYIKGKDYGKSLIKMLNSYRKDTPYSTIYSLEQYVLSVENDLLEYGIKNPKKHPNFMEVYEKFTILKKVLENSASVSETVAKLTNMFTSSKDALPLMTVHKSKGLEFDRVFIMRNDLIPSKFSTNEFDLEQERNLDWVMRSRAKKELIYITDFVGDAKEGQVQMSKLNKNGQKWITS